MTLDPSAVQSSKEIPIKIYETLKDPSTSKIQLEPVGYRIETNEGERVAVGHVAMASKEDNKRILVFLFVVIANLVSQTNALTMLHTRINFVVDFVKEVESGRISADDALLRDIASICSRLPTVEGSDFEAQFNKVS